ncbi:PA2778 family cysteine peptidase [Metapseudomonas otitidis]|uniref:PA2778 family cysteine peptidase n=1 Tax=Metapseudomonas otitidis TaxID=319939 RepID=UPI001F39FB64|nr:PA2778 family cysteine peptidase [Pseudomonas otitidis]
MRRSRFVACSRQVVMACLVPFLLVACAGHDPADDPRVRALPMVVELSSVPFFAQQTYQSAPASLAALFGFQGETVTPGMVEKALQLPEAEASLAQRIPVVAHQHGLLVYSLDKHLEDLLVQVAAGNPVLVHLRQGYGWLPSWRYAVLVGFDREREVVLLRLAGDRRAQVGFAEFAADWAAAGQWAVLLQAPNALPVAADMARWQAAADALAAAGQVDAADMARKQVR